MEYGLGELGCTKVTDSATGELVHQRHQQSQQVRCLVGLPLGSCPKGRVPPLAFEALAGLARRPNQDAKQHQSRHPGPPTRVRSLRYAIMVNTFYRLRIACLWLSDVDCFVTKFNTLQVDACDRLSN